MPAERLQKILSRAGVTSRRKAEDLIVAGRVTVNGAAVTPSLAHAVGVNLIAGKWFKDETEVVISSALWRRLGGDTAILGKTITLNGRGFTVVGVMPPAFRLPVVNTDSLDARNDVWIGLDPNGRGQDRHAGYLIVYARLKPGVTLFGELLPARALERSIELARTAGLVLVVGSTLEVWPVAGLPLEARSFAIVNRGPTALDEPALLKIDAPAGETLAAAVDALG